MRVTIKGLWAKVYTVLFGTARAQPVKLVSHDTVVVDGFESLDILTNRIDIVYTQRGVTRRITFLTAEKEVLKVTKLGG